MSRHTVVRAVVDALRFAALAAGLLVTASCGDGGGAPGLRPGKLDADTPPVTFTQPSAQALSSSVIGQTVFTFNVENTSHCDIAAVKFAAVLFDESGKRVPGDPQEVGVAGEMGDIHPGETYECKFTTGGDRAVRAVAVLKEVVYVFVPEGESNAMYRVPMKWLSRKFESEVAAAAPR